MNRAALLTVLVVFLLPGHGRAARSSLIAPDGEAAYAHHVSPVVGQAGTVLSTARDPVPSTSLLVSGGFRFGEQVRGRAVYRSLSSALLVGGRWQPSGLPLLCLGGEFVAFQTNTIHTRVPPVVEEKSTFADLGNLRLGVTARLLELARPVGDRAFELTLSPFFYLGLPTDTSRLREEQHMPVRAVVDGTVFDGPYLTIEPGVSASATLWVFGLHTHQALLIAPVVDGRTQAYWSMHTWLTADIAQRVDIVLQVDALLASRERYQMEPFGAWGLSPAVRLHTGAVSWELAARLAISEDGYAPFGDVSGIFTFYWHPDR